jgi:polyhydroxybutyrate depolymerase
VRVRLGTMFVVLALLLAGCSGSDGGDSGDGGAGDGGDAGGGGASGEVNEGGSSGESAAPIPSAGCDGAATEQADLVEATMPVAGAERRWLLSAPAWESGDEPLPLVLDFHGLSEGADVHAGMSQLGPLGVAEGFVTVFPHGTGAPLKWDVNPVLADNVDLQFVTAVLDRVEEERCIDTSRVYATGLSYGAMMTSAVACELSDRVAAVAPVAGIILPEGCEPAHPMPVLTFHGTADPILLFNGGVGAIPGMGEPAETTETTLPPADLEGPGYPDTVRQWAELAGCENSFEDEEVSDTVIRRVYDCPADAPVEFVVVEGGGHSWPSSEFSRSIEEFVGHTTFDIDASREMWEFFQRFSLPAD